MQLSLSLLMIGVFKERGGVPGRQYMEPLIHQCTGGLSHHDPHFLLFITVIIVMIVIINILAIILDRARLGPNVHHEHHPGAAAHRPWYPRLPWQLGHLPPSYVNNKKCPKNGYNAF